MTVTPALLSRIEVRECELGRGVFATRLIEQGEMILLFTGRSLTFTEQLQLPDEANALQVGLDEYLDTEAPGVYVNHSCRPNAIMRNRTELIACCDIQAGEEVRFDYSTTMLERHWELEGCRCGAPDCRGTIQDFDLLPEHVQQLYLEADAVQPFIVESVISDQSRM